MHFASVTPSLRAETNYGTGKTFELSNGTTGFEISIMNTKHKAQALGVGANGNLGLKTKTASGGLGAGLNGAITGETATMEGVTFIVPRTDPADLQAKQIMQLTRILIRRK